MKTRYYGIHDKREVATRRFGGAQALCGAEFIWDFYKDAVVDVSKSYMAGGTSCAIRRGKPSLCDLTVGYDGAR